MARTYRPVGFRKGAREARRVLYAKQEAYRLAEISRLADAHTKRDRERLARLKSAERARVRLIAKENGISPKVQRALELTREQYGNVQNTENPWSVWESIAKQYPAEIVAVIENSQLNNKRWIAGGRRNGIPFGYHRYPEFKDATDEFREELPELFYYHFG